VALDRLVVVRVPRPAEVPRAADQLARSNGFGLLVLDLGDLAPTSLPAPLWSRLGGLASKHGLAIVCLTRTPAQAPSLGALVSLRAQAERVPRKDGSFGCTLRVIKDRRRQPGWTHREDRRGPLGLR
jgi:recombination protein RecA